MRKPKTKMDLCRFILKRILLLVFICQLQPAGKLFSQGFEIWNPADRSLPWVSDINPAIIPYQNTQVSLGLRVFHLGFLPGRALGLRENRVNFSFPFFLPYDLGFGLQMRYFSTGLYSELAASFLLGREIRPDLSVGLKVGLERRGFNAANFNVEDPGDPLLAGGLSRMNLNLGAGAYWAPGNFRLGLGIDHANRTNIGEMSQAIFPREISLALGYQIGFLTPTVLIHDDGTRWRFGFTLTAMNAGAGSIRFGYEDSMPLKLEARLNLNKRSRLNYRLDLPKSGTRGASAGTQELVFTQILGRRPEIGQPQMLFTTRKLEIKVEKVVRKMAPSLNKRILARLPELTPEYLSSKSHAQNMLLIQAGALNRFESKAARRKRWRKLANTLVKFLSANPSLQAFILADQRSLNDAKIIKRMADRILRAPHRIQISGTKPRAGQPDLRSFMPGQVTLQRKPPRLSTPKLGINLRVKSKTRRTRGWILSIRNRRGQTFAQFYGKGKLPEQIEWDWRDRRQKLVPPGEYFFQLVVVTTAGRKRTAISKPIHITWIKRTVFIKLNSEAEMRTSKTTKSPIIRGEM
ncbi:MAG: type IX secretion system membrane protein PorP/SprF [Calditrichaeota bacterium]|nr:MAG: type IX secretion system membrane protein PorP/SprF [Calditrichota bacterium]